eukprot:TRINITY_DN6030_c1_g1_i1.p2 TRINITY_DN6030_c1_g1~~TRINITY_DN6030_c1_g1_i1.p2  ORF type:complete len:261 (+),score=98.41 TRINITY_DN6030_c1_g1_i1:523-1305(+)
MNDSSISGLGGAPALGPTSASRISALTDKLGRIQSGLETERHSRLDAVEHRLRTLDTRVSALNDDAKFEPLRGALARFADAMAEERAARGATSAAASAGVAQCEERLSRLVATEAAQRTEAERFLDASLADKTGHLAVEVAEAARGRERAAERNTHASRVEIPQLYEALGEQVSRREDTEMRLIRKLSEDIARVHAALASEKQAREETEEALVKMMEEVFGRLQGELEQEKAARKETEATLVRLLEDTCVKVSAAPQSVI